MKRLLLLSLLTTLFMVQLNAQWGQCEPNLMYADSTFGVYPPPVSMTNPDGGIPETACLGEDYFFTWTIKIPETLDAGLLILTIDSLVVGVEDSIIGLPTGMIYSMNPPD